jgi:hypothetical protein
MGEGGAESSAEGILSAIRESLVSAFQERPAKSALGCRSGRRISARPLKIVNSWLFDGTT